MNRLLSIAARTLLLPALCCTALVVFNSCSEVTQPEDTVRSTMTVRTELRREENGATTIVPLSDVRVSVKRLNGVAAGTSRLTDSRGEAAIVGDVPVTGDDFIVEAFSPDYGTRSDTVHGVCGDARVRFMFRETAAVELNCNTLDDNQLQLLFTDNQTGSEKLIQNAPNPLRNCLPVAKNTGRDNITLDIPTAATGVFTVAAVQIDDRLLPVTGNPMRVTLPPGSVLALCIDVNTSTTSNNAPNGRFEEALRLRAACEGGPTVDLDLTLQATVVEETCDCRQFVLTSSQTLQLSEPVAAGDEETLSGAVFTNNGPCPVRVRVKAVTPTPGRNDWQITSPAALQQTGGEVRLEQGQTLEIDAVFRPLSATTRVAPSTLRLELEILPEGDPVPCDLTVDLTGEACDDVCPSLRVNGRDYAFGTPAVPRDSLYIRNDKRVFISDEEPSTVTEEYEFVLNSSDTLVCNLGDVSLRMEALPGDPHSLQYFTLGSTSVPLRTGGAVAGSFDMTFTAPTLQELRQILVARNAGGPPRTADSMFTVRVIMTVSGCPADTLLVDAIVTTLPDFTPPIKLHAYRQTTPKQPKPEYEFYVFGESAVQSLRNDNAPPSNGPEQGDLWVDVPNPNGPLPQQPFIKNEANVEWALWQNISDESFFNNVLQIVQQVQNGVGSGAFTFNTGDITQAAPGNLAVGNVYIFRFSATRYGVMVIREINNGTENNLNNQSAVHFRALYPVLIN